MANLEMTVHVKDIEEVNQVVECAGKLVEIIEGNNFSDAGFLLKWSATYQDLRSSLTDLAEVIKKAAPEVRVQKRLEITRIPFF